MCHRSLATGLKVHLPVPVSGFTTATLIVLSATRRRDQMIELRAVGAPAQSLNYHANQACLVFGVDLAHVRGMRVCYDAKFSKVVRNGQEKENQFSCAACYLT